jgi:hypothetical protein
MGDVLKLNRSANDGIEPLKKGRDTSKRLEFTSLVLGL